MHYQPSLDLSTGTGPVEIQEKEQSAEEKFTLISSEVIAMSERSPEKS